MKKLIFVLLIFFILYNRINAEDYFDQYNVQPVNLNTGTIMDGNVYFGLEKINSDYLDIATTIWAGDNRLGQWYLNNGNGTFGTFTPFNPQCTGVFKGNVFIKLQSSSFVKDLVVGRSDGLQVHWNQGGITGVHQDFYVNFGTIGGPYFEPGIFDASDNFEDILVSNGTTTLFYFINNKNGTLSNCTTTTLPNNVFNFKIRQLTEKAEGYVQYNLNDRSDITFIKKVTPTGFDWIYAYSNNFANGFNTQTPLLGFQSDFEDAKDIEAADLDGDSYNDVAAIGSIGTGCPDFFRINTYKNEHGYFIDNTPFWSYTTNRTYPCESAYKIKAADLNKDGLNDLVCSWTYSNLENSYIKVIVFINQNSWPPFTAGPQQEIDINISAEGTSPIITQIMTADIYGGQEQDGGGIALVVSYYIEVNGGDNKELHVKVINTIDPTTYPPPPILQRLVYQDGSTWHPWIHLNNRGERDFRRYDIYKFKTGWTNPIIIHQGPEDDFIDLEECMDLSGGDQLPWNCYYYAKEVDWVYNVSIPSKYAYYIVCNPNCGACIPVCDGCQGDNPFPHQNQINNKQPEKFTLSNYPNPFNPTTTIHFTLPEASKVNLIIYNSLGQIVTELANGYYEAGEYNIQFDGKNLSSGIYYYRINSVGFTQTNKMLLFK